MLHLVTNYGCTLLELIPDRLVTLCQLVNLGFPKLWTFRIAARGLCVEKWVIVEDLGTVLDFKR